MEEKLQEILDDYEEQITRYEHEIKTLESRIQFCGEHKFDEELRICIVKYDSLNMAIYKWRNMHKEIQELLNKWLS